jgi:hypothetical protein
MKDTTLLSALAVGARVAVEPASSVPVRGVEPESAGVPSRGPGARVIWVLDRTALPTGGKEALPPGIEPAPTDSPR